MEVSRVPEQHIESKKDGKTEKEVSTGPEVEVEALQDPILYSKTSIFFMVLFSGLAIGSDAYNSALMGQLLLLFTELYPTTLTVAKQSQLTNAFIIGLVSRGFLRDHLAPANNT